MNSNHKHVSDYIIEIDTIYRQGNATEHSYRHALKALFDNLTTGLSITNEPKHISCGAPDYVISKNNIPLGFIEAKDISKGINNKADSQQFARYREALGNLLITDYIHFHYYKDSNLTCTVTIAEEKNGRIIENKNEFDNFIDMVNQFIAYNGRTIHKSEMLARLMAGKTKLLAEILKEAVSDNENGNLFEQLTVFKEYLIHDLAEEQFADIYAQTIAYGLFAAKLYKTDDYVFTRLSAANLIPKSNPFLKRFFHYIVGPDLDSRIVWIVDAIADMFNTVDIEAIKKEFADIDKDPYIHFYETFLKEFDKTARKERGVYYTPSPVVKFIVNAIDGLLKSEFNIKNGLADNSITEENLHKVQILDPATGTGTFLSEVIDKIYSYFKTNQGIWPGYCEKHLVPRIHGFEYLMASFVIAHLKTDMKLKETGFHKTDANERLGIYLTNTLEEPKEEIKDLGLVRWLTDEAKAAQKIKKNMPIMVVLGNPPYNVESKNKFNDTVYLDYKKEPGGIEKLNEKNIQPLNDDYVKFIAYGHSLIKKYKEGILAYINNNGFLDNLIFRGMRWSLLNTFDTIYILNLHGDSAKPAVIKDENVFNIKKGVSINIFVKNNKEKGNALAEVYYAEIQGDRNIKFEYLLNNTISRIKWKKLKLTAPHYFFIPKNVKQNKEYKDFFGITELFMTYSSGLETGRDDFTVKNSREELENTINKFLTLENEKAREVFKLGSDSRDWRIDLAKKDLAPNNGKPRKPDFTNIIKYQYRPFDVRYTYYTGNSKGFHMNPRENIMRHLITGDNIALVTGRQSSVHTWENIGITKNITDACYVSSRSKEKGYILPLYIYSFDNGDGCHTNLSMEIIKKIEEKTGLKFVLEKKSRKSFEPVDIVHYIYAVLYSPKYREKYREELLIDFPRITYPKDGKEFKELVKHGKRLSSLHLMENVENKQNGINYQGINYPVDGNNKIGPIKYSNNKVWINENQYFEPVNIDVWEYFMGSYQPAKKWLKDRKDKILSYEDIQHYMNIIYVISETIEIQKKIDAVMG
ncbi:MAG: N-6 DNA methylase [Treponema sp.]|nr:N-6 DNA methylase [Treponema sp.]